ncbi:uncharacterized protein RCO7_04777 [Rhynchosporium graminicola]|uniref:Uncharacterized protein n=1 Tax=Rhynchosporium graminicola TaxID=2792576 RepID=A0A1E1KF27_9HELO|nr:uncharacterized protein RCO7_04777 [Rhynchosporium commune]
MSAVAMNLTRWSISSNSDNSFSALQRVAAEAKLWYMRDVTDPEDFQILVDQELTRQKHEPTVSTIESAIQTLGSLPSAALYNSLGSHDQTRNLWTSSKLPSQERHTHPGGYDLTRTILQQHKCIWFTSLDIIKVPKSTQTAMEPGLNTVKSPSRISQQDDSSPQLGATSICTRNFYPI